MVLGGVQSHNKGKGVATTSSSRTPIDEYSEEEEDVDKYTAENFGRQEFKNLEEE